ncbi:sulfatase-like hydrolase/transferase [bacterium]|jgi:phosphoglycerol transferase MdoB-like AlkP superfamily enzyme|nr:sulfatase-like hydrolase/transferase [bacterium]
MIKLARIFKHNFFKSIGPYDYFVFVCHLFHLINMHSTSGLAKIKDVTFLAVIKTAGLSIVSVVTLYLFFQVIRLIFSKNRFSFVFINFLSLLIYSFLVSYLYTTKISFDFAILISNFQSAFSREAFSVIITNLIADPIAIAVLGIICFFILEIKYKTVSRFSEPIISKKLVILSITYVLFIINFESPYDEITRFNQSIYFYFNNPYISEDVYKEGAFPLIKEQFKYNNPVKFKERPHVFLIVVESFNSNYVDSTHMPFFNQLISKGLYIDQFYGNSIQTCKGHFSTLFSLIPSMRSSVFKQYAYLNAYSLPNILKDNGYSTLFFQAHEDLHFDNTNDVLLSNGFESHESVHNYLRKEDSSRVWGWGARDDLFYERFFEYLDDRHQGTMSDKPMFVTLATISNHMDFSHAPEDQRFIFPNPTKPKEHYANSIFLTDIGLKQFFKELESRDYLENSVVIIVGDHGFPLGDHGIYQSENGYFDESFRTPFLMVWNNRLEPRIVAEESFSQVDIAPSLVDLLNLDLERNHFQGTSFFEESASSNSVVLVQPYNGISLSVVQYPHKYTQNLRTKEAYFFNLKKDPKEMVNLINDPEVKPFIGDLKSKMKTVFLNQVLIQKNAVWNK